MYIELGLTVAVREEREHGLISSPVSTLSANNNMGRNESSSSENPEGN